MKRLSAALLFMTLAFSEGAAAPIAAAPSNSIPGTSVAQRDRTNKAAISFALPRPVTFRFVKERGLLLNVWVNDTGPYTFAVDTGAGVTLISSRVAARAGASQNGSRISLGGLSGVSKSDGTNTNINSLAVGFRANSLRPGQRAIIIDNLPADIDGVLDPTDAYSPFGYSIDLPNRELAAFDPKDSPLNINASPEGGTVVRWLSSGAARRPFVRLEDGRLALLDTGSGFGLAISGTAGAAGRLAKASTHDLGGGEIRSQRVAASTITIGSLTLRGVPTDILSGVENNVPVLLGRDVLYPFRLTFDPVHRLIEIAPASP